MRTVFLILLVASGCISCVNEVTLDFRDYQTQTVINSLLVPDSLIRVHISESVCSDKEDAFPPVNNANVGISDGKNRYTPVTSENGHYTFPIRPVSGENYTLNVTSADGKTFAATTKIPVQPDIRLLPLEGENYVKLVIRDHPSENNFYWVGIRIYDIPGTKFVYENYVQSNFLLFDDFNRTRSEDRFGRKTYAYHFYARLTDLTFNGGQAEFKIPHFWVPQEDFTHINFRIYLFVINADPHLDQYMKAALMQYELSVIGDMPVFHTPVNMYTNVENGKGIFGSYTFTEFDITFPATIP